jgi:non-heme Fe2+,alpha-ketoglutarate-dependent halogenase
VAGVLPEAMPAETNAHFDAVAGHYEDAFFYEEGPREEWLLREVAAALDVPAGLEAAGCILADIGGGTGAFTSRLHAKLDLGQRALCVDPSPGMLKVAEERKELVPVLADAVAFAADESHVGGYDRALLKEVVHCIPPEGVAPMYQGIQRQLRDGGVSVTMTRPQEPEYPLFAAARQVWRENQPPSETFAEAMRDAGFEDVEVRELRYPCRLPLDRWCTMMRQRFWSTFSHFSDEELEEGIAEVAAKHAGKDDVEFDEILLAIVGRKPAAPFAAPATLRPAADASTVAADCGDRGFGSGLPILSASEAQSCLMAFEEYEEFCGGRVAGDARFKTHLLLPWMWRLIHNERLLDAVQAALGTPNLLCWSTDFFVKEPGDGGFASWHQDAAYVGMEPPDALTAWIALTPSSLATGCVKALPGSHRGPLEPHAETRDPKNLLLLGQSIEGISSERLSEAVAFELDPGEASMHHLNAIHASEPNAAGGGRRIGVAIRFAGAHVVQHLDPRDSVVVVRGSPVPGAYAEEPAPAGWMCEDGLKAHSEAVQRVYPPPMQGA